MRRFAVLGVVVGCYSPTITPGARSQDGSCPTGLTCDDGRCVEPGTSDARAHGPLVIDGAIDGLALDTSPRPAGRIQPAHSPRAHA